MRTVIEAAKLSKKYRLYGSGLDRLKDWLAPASKKFHEELWALREVSFAVEEGECLGVIGANGAGKSTLLRVLCGISAPTGGSLQIRGRLSSLLDLGMGFHPLLTGRENLCLGGGFLGLGEEEVSLRLDDMVRFAELGDFIDRPIRIYSAGMLLRLGFAAAVGMDPDVLVIDEVLAVGDEYFRRKSLNRVQYFKDAGKSIVLVSHDLSVIQRFCRRALWLHDGRTRMLGDSREIVRAYEQFSRQNGDSAPADGGAPARQEVRALRPQPRPDGRPPLIGARWGDGAITLDAVEMVGPDGRAGWNFATGDAVAIRLSYTARQRVENPVFAVLVHSLDGVLLFAAENCGIEPRALGPVEGGGVVECRLARLDLNAGDYLLSVAAFSEPDEPFWSHPADYHNQAYEFRMRSDGPCYGPIRIAGRWERLEEESAERREAQP